MRGGLAGGLRRAVDIREHEAGAVFWSCAYFFFLLCSYYVIRPIRDEMGVRGGVENLPWLFTGTLVGMLLVHPIFTALVSRVPRRRFVPLIYGFFILNLLLFFLAFRAAGPAASVWIGRVFFIWVSVYNLFVVSVFWSFMTDLYRPSQGKRLFGLVAVGGTLGAVFGSSITAALARGLGPVNLLLVSGALLGVAVIAAGLLEREEPRVALDADEAATAGPVARGREVVGGRVLEGIRDVLRSPYLLGIALLMLLFTVSSTFLYFQQADIIARTFGHDSQARTRMFANIDLAVNILTLLTQVFLTGRILRWLGMALALAFLPALTLAGFALLWASPVLAVVVAFQVLRRAGHFAIERPAREGLYTVLSRTEKYKAKNFNDTFIYRVGDQVGAWSYRLMGGLGLGASGLAATMVPVSLLWLLVALWLGRRYQQMAEGVFVKVPAAAALTADRA
jgi:AAA family ATP:ADP antiporter